jgi:hypothetical protein
MLNLPTTATWSESAQSMDHTFNIFQAAVMYKGEIALQGYG